MIILVTGKYGQVGFELQYRLAPQGEVFGVDQVECDLADPDAIRQLVQQNRTNLAAVRALHLLERLKTGYFLAARR